MTAVEQSRSQSRTAPASFGRGAQLADQRAKLKADINAELVDLQIALDRRSSSVVRSLTSSPSPSVSPTRTRTPANRESERLRSLETGEAVINDVTENETCLPCFE